MCTKTLRFPAIAIAQQPIAHRLLHLLSAVGFSHALVSDCVCRYAPLPPQLAADFGSLLQLMLQPDPKQRPSVSDILQLPSVRQRIAELPNPMLLDTQTEQSPAHSVVGEHQQFLAMAGGDAASVPRTTVASGSSCWAKHGSDGVWHRGVVQAAVDGDSYFIQVAHAPPFCVLGWREEALQ